MRKLRQSLLLSGAFLLALAAIYVVHARFLQVGVIFYSALLDAAIAAFGVFALSLALGRRLALGGLEHGQLLVIWLLAGYAFAISGPTVLDRSLSFYILEKLQQRGGGIRAEAMPRLFIDEYMDEFRLVDVRLTEQQESGTIEIRDGCVRLTPWGDRLASISHFIRTTLLARHRLLMGHYTDALVDPLARSPKGPQGYECR